MEAKAIKTNNKIIFIILLYVIAIAVLIYFVILLSIKNIKTTSNSIIDHKVKDDIYFENLSKERDLGKDIKTIESDIKRIDEFFIKKDYELDFIKELEDLSNKNKLDQKMFMNYDNSTEENQYRKLPIQINLYGYFENIFDYIKDLESLNYYIDIQSIELRKSSNNSLMPATSGSIDNSPSFQKKIDAIILLDSYFK